MLAKINKIKNLGLVFADFSWSAEVPDFKRYNLVYGWNGSGKTTLTRLVDEIAAPSDTGVQYELEDSDGGKFGPEDAFPTPVRVFNQDYIQKNVRVLESKANTISILLGAQNKELIAQIESDEQELNGDSEDPSKLGKLREFDDAKREKEQHEKAIDIAFRDTARTIGVAIAGSGAASRTYRSPNAKTDFEKLSTPAVLADKDLDALILALKQELFPKLDPITIATIEIDEANAAFLDVVDQCLEDAKQLCSATVEAEMISRLSANPDISVWVDQGLLIHEKHESSNCEYCGNVISEDRLSQLARHFNEADRKVKARIDGVLEKLREVNTALREMTPYDPARLYGELRKPYQIAVTQLTEAKNDLASQITALGEALQDKKARTGEDVALDLKLDTDTLVQLLGDVNTQVEAHNAKSSDFQSIQASAVRDIKNHYLSTIHEDVTQRNASITKLDERLEKLGPEIAEIKKRIATARASISSNHKACEQINSDLRTFLGHEEIRFEPETGQREDEADSESDSIIGYRIMRGKQPAAYLSEGEKTAIAFVYFVVHLNDGQFPKSDGIVVIDDPISSFDSNSLYQAFSFLKNAVVDCHQVFILTHSFEFLKLLLNWRSRGRRRHTGFYMIRNHLIGDERRASIDEMDRELKDYESEYQYLFKCLKEMQEEQDGTIMRAYPVPNIARKVWETFLLFRVPSGQPPYSKMEQLKQDGFDAQKLDAIYKFTNDQSHITGAGFDPALVPGTQKVLGELFEMMEEIAPDHYAILDKATGQA